MKRLCAGAALALLSAVSMAATVPGAIGGSFSVSPGGAATYTIPIEVPKGRNGLQPDLALVYNSQGGNGPVGVGWSLAGVSSIYRCPQTMQHDGRRLGLTYGSLADYGPTPSTTFLSPLPVMGPDTNDRFCLDGNRLIRVDVEAPESGQPLEPYFANSAIYRTAVDRQDVVVLDQRGTSPSNYWMRWNSGFLRKTRDGLVFQYGGALSDGHGEASQSGALPGRASLLVRSTNNGSSYAYTPSQWFVSTVTNSLGDVMEYTYVHYSNGNDTAYDTPGLTTSTHIAEAYVSKIYYGANDRTDANDHARVEFIYETRPDVTFRYVSGVKIQQRKRLKEIVTYLNNIEQRRYTLTYDSSASTSRSRLTSVTLCAGADCYPATTVSWQQNPNTFGSVSSITLPPAYLTDCCWSEKSRDTGGRAVDLNKDGLPDLIRMYTGVASQVWLNGPGGNISSTPDAAYTASLPSGEVFSLASSSLPMGGDGGVRLTDVNADGFPDLLVLRKTGSTESRGVWINTGTQFVARNGTGEIGSTLPTTAFLSIDGRSSGVELQDLNRDNYLDIVQHYKDHAGALHTGVWFGSASGFSAEPAPQSPETANFSLVLATLPPFIDATGWTTANPPKDKGLRLQDFTGDGYPDLLRMVKGDSSTFLFWRNLGNKFVQSSYTLPTGDSAVLGFVNSDGADLGVRIADFNGDGLADIIHSQNTLLAGGSLYRSAYLNTGRGFLKNTPYSDAMSDVNFNMGGLDGGTRLADLNGDGLMDVLQSFMADDGNCNNESYFRKVNLNLGEGFVNSPSFEGSIPNKPISFIDFQCEAAYLMGPVGAQLVDWNGDGLLDYFLLRNANNKGVYLQQGGANDVVTQIARGDSMSAKSSYVPATDQQVFQRSTGAVLPVLDTQPGGYLVSESEVSDGVGGFNKTLHRYGGAKAHLTYGGLGYAWTETLAQATKTKVRTEYSQAFPYTGMPTGTFQYFCNIPGQPVFASTCTDLLTETTLVPAVKYFYDDRIYFPYTATTTTKTYEPPVVP